MPLPPYLRPVGEPDGLFRTELQLLVHVLWLPAGRAVAADLCMVSACLEDRTLS